MKKKFLILMPIFIFALIFLAKMPTYASTYDKGFVEYTLPNQYEAWDNEEYQNGFYTQYSYPTQSGYNNEISISAGKGEEGLTPPTEQDIENYIQSEKSSYQGTDDIFIINDDMSGKLIEINGVPGYKITYTLKQKSDGQVFSYGFVALVADSASCYIWIKGPDQYVFSDEVNKIINSIKIKDTVLKYKGIPFTDVSKKAWYYNAVKYVYDNKIVSGYNSYTFAPEEKLTRGMIVTILYNMEGSPNNDGKSKFTDVNATEWYAKAVKWAVDNNIVYGYGGTSKFGPNDNIIRQDLAGILRNYAKYKGKNINVTSDLTKFKDYKKIDNYANVSMQWAVGKEVITGNGDGTLNPKGSSTRSEAAAMIQKYCNKVGK